MAARQDFQSVEYFGRKVIVSLMRYKTSGWISLGWLFSTVLPLNAGDLKNPDFEAQGGWKIATQGSSMGAAFDDDTSQTGRKSFVVSLDWKSPTKKEDFVGISQVVEIYWQFSRTQVLRPRRQV